MQNLRYLLARSRTLVSPHACEHSQALFPSSRHVKYSAFGARVFYVQKRLRLMASKDLQQLALELPMFQNKVLSIKDCPTLRPAEFSNTVSH